MNRKVPQTWNYSSIWHYHCFLPLRPQFNAGFCFCFVFWNVVFMKIVSLFGNWIMFPVSLTALTTCFLIKATHAQGTPVQPHFRARVSTQPPTQTLPITPLPLCPFPYNWCYSLPPFLADKYFCQRSRTLMSRLAHTPLSKLCQSLEKTGHFPKILD